MWLTALLNLCIMCTVTGVEFEAEGLLTARDWSYASKESSVYWHRRLGSNESALSLTMDSGVKVQKLIIEIGKIVVYILLALGILLFIFSWILPWKTAGNEQYFSQSNIDWERAIFRRDSTLVPAIDEEEIKSVVLEYERTARLYNNRANDFTYCKNTNAVFNNTRPVVTPFTRKLSTLPPSNRIVAEHLVKSNILDDVFEKCALSENASESSVNLGTLPFLDGSEIRSKDDKSLKSPSVKKSLSFYFNQGLFETDPNKQKIQNTNYSLSIDTSSSVKRLSIQVNSVGIPL